MKTFNVTKRVSKQARQMCEEIINTHERYSKAYFWSSNANASDRRYAEQKFMEEHPDVCFVKDGTEIRVSFYYKQSCRNVYYKLDVSIYENGELIKHGNIKDVKKIIHA